MVVAVVMAVIVVVIRGWRVVDVGDGFDIKCISSGSCGGNNSGVSGTGIDNNLSVYLPDSCYLTIIVSTGTVSLATGRKGRTGCTSSPVHSSA